MPTSRQGGIEYSLLNIEDWKGKRLVSRKDDMLKCQAFHGKEIMLSFPKNNNIYRRESMVTTYFLPKDYDTFIG
ncbi:MAG: hypothetical protein ACUZ8I_12575, partial [Candidatus Scalindua sp.]